MRIDAFVIPYADTATPFYAESQPDQTQYEFVRSFISGMIEPVRLTVGWHVLQPEMQTPDSVWMYVHEEGKLLGLGINRRANNLCWHFNRDLLLGGDFIVGTAVIVGSLDPSGSHSRLTDKQRHKVSEAILLREATTNKEQ